MSDDGRRYWDRHARRYDRSMLLLGRPMPRMLELVAESVRGAERVLEVAAGTGLVTAALARSAKEVVATDYAGAMVAELEARRLREGWTNVRTACADLYALPFAPESFDAVVAANVLHLVPDLPGALAALLRVARPGARVLTPTFAHAETRTARGLSRLASLAGFPVRRRFTARGLAEALAAAGVHVTRVEVLPGVFPIAFVEGVRPASTA